jgi:hypothetical protein
MEPGFFYCAQPPPRARLYAIHGREVMALIMNGNLVLYTDESGVDHDALVVFVHSRECINLVYVSKQEGKTDGNGQQIERANSVSRKGPATAANGRFFEEIDYTKMLP